MRSHTYDFSRRDLLRLLGWPLVPVALFAVLMHAAAGLRLLPPPRPTLDVDRTILVHRVEAARRASEASVLLVGDSSCLMSVDARALGTRLGQPVLNLGLLSYLDVEAYAALVREYVASNPGRLRHVVLLQHPEALRRPAPEEYHVKLFQSLLRGELPEPAPGFRGQLTALLGLDSLQARVLARVVPTALSGAYGRFYGFSDNLEAFLTEHRGSLIDPESKRFEGDADYRLAPQLESGSRTFRGALPSGVKLLAGITPAPESFVRKGYAQARDQMLTQWGQWLQADAVLTNLPATLPDARFARTTHLNADGARAYSELLAATLAQQLK